jgi:hypothetical protein
MKIRDIIVEAVNRFDDFGHSDFRAYDEPDQRSNWAVFIDGKQWKVFRTEQSANRAASTIAQKYDKKTDVYATMDPVSENMGESATAGATSSGSIASVENPKVAYSKPRRDSKGVPKAPQKTKPNGTAVNALDMGASLFGKGAVKR